MSDTPLSRFGTARDLERDEGLTPEVNAELRKALSDGLLEYCKNRNTNNFSSEMAHYLHIALRSLIGKHDHPLFQMNRGRGESGRDPTKHDCIAEAVRYIRAARKGLIDDSNPVETVIVAFTEKATDATLDQRTVERWLGSSYWAEVEPEVDKIELLPGLMTFSGRCYGQNFAS